MFHPKDFIQNILGKITRDVFYVVSVILYTRKNKNDFNIGFSKMMVNSTNGKLTMYENNLYMKKESWLKIIFDEMVEIIYILLMIGCIAFGWFWFITNL